MVCAVRDINDFTENAKELAKLLKNRLAFVNHINYNENECLPFKIKKYYSFNEYFENG